MTLETATGERGLHHGLSERPGSRILFLMPDPETIGTIDTSACSTWSRMSGTKPSTRTLGERSHSFTWAALPHFPMTVSLNRPGFLGGSNL